MTSHALDSRSSSEGLARDADAELASAQPDAYAREQLQVRNRQQVDGILASSTADGHAAVDPGLAEAKQALILLRVRQVPLSARNWKLLATHAWTLAEDGRDAATLADCLRLAKVSWENVTEDQRAVFMSLSGREDLRRELLTNSRLFDAITSMQVGPGGFIGDAVAERRREEVEQFRSQPGAAFTFNDEFSVARLVSGDTVAKALTEPVTRGDHVVNRELAGWVRRQNETQVEAEIHRYACAIGNLFALAFSRGQVVGWRDPSTPPTAEALKEWLKSWTLDRKGGLLDVPTANAATLTYSPGGVVAAAAASTVAPEGFHRRLSWSRSEKGSQEERSASLTKMVSTQLGGLSLGAEQESRLALTQGKVDKDHAHVYFLYKDLDSVWRPMDVYLLDEDQPEQADGTNSEHVPLITQLFFVVDQP